MVYDSGRITYEMDKKRGTCYNGISVSYTHLAFLRTNISAIVGMMVAALGVLHVFFNTYYRITEDDVLIAHCSIFPEKKIAIADIEALESTVMPVSSYALSLDRLIIWSNGKPWMLISPTNRADFIKQLRKINPNIQLK